MTETIEEATARAAGILVKNDYLVLSTVDESGPWAAVVAYAVAAPGFLYFVSRRNSRHADAVDRDPRIAGVVYDPATSPDDSDSFQFSGTCAEVSDESLVRLFLERTEHLTEDSVDEELAAFREDEDLRLYRIAVHRGYVLDQEKWIEHGVDARKEVLVEGTFARAEAASPVRSV
ncbi:pyridoxamine 5'-phosphate oxidase family protein [Amycolatopsis sp. NPDC059021]|uniref:pyridoxamine 5'-phosphate oxidase family protein n=1 Tax=Amycolatopsis sp. NPDC059021 TaxID=3346704 RepID=UPI00366B502E